jgi:hemin uptake protein HemP
MVYCCQHHPTYKLPLVRILIPQMESAVSDARTTGDVQRQPVQQATAGLSAAPRTLRSEDILQGAREVLIQHGLETYRLRVTKAGKLILNK